MTVREEFDEIAESSVTLQFGSVEGFNAHLSYIPQRRIGVVVLANVDVFIADTIAAQLQSVALGRPVTLPAEHKILPIAKEELMRFVGVYSLPAIAPDFTLTIEISDRSMSARPTGRDPIMLDYEGAKDGHLILQNSSPKLSLFRTQTDQSHRWCCIWRVRTSREGSAEEGRGARTSCALGCVNLMA